MNAGSLDLLNRLGSGVRPDGSTSGAPAAALDGAGFADLLARVREGAMSSGQPVEIAPGAKVELSADQLERLAVAIDAAEAAGHHRVLTLIDGQALAVDVPGRMVLESISSGDARLLSDFDAVISVPAGSVKELRSLFSAGIAGRAEASPYAGLGMVRNQSLSDLLAASTMGTSANESKSAAHEAA